MIESKLKAKLQPWTAVSTLQMFLLVSGHKKNYCDLNLGESLCILTFFLFSDSGLNLLNGFDFYLEWRDTENQQYISEQLPY